jgi:hypothetical protein
MPTVLFYNSVTPKPNTVTSDNAVLSCRWKEQKEAMLSKIKDTTKADDDCYFDTN